MKALIIYKGKYGATAQYAKWCGEELDLPVKNADETDGELLNQYDWFIIGTSVYIGKLQIRKWLIQNAPYLKAKKIFLFQVAGSRPDEIEKREKYNAQSIPPDILKYCEPFYLPGRLILKKLSFFDRFMINMGAWLEKKKAVKDMMLTDHDDVKKEHVSGLIDAVKKYRAVELSGTAARALEIH